MAVPTSIVHTLVDFIFPDCLSIVLTGILCSSVTVNHSSFQRWYVVRAFSRVWTHRSAFIFVSIARLRTPRSKQSKIAEKYSFSLDAWISVMSVTHFSSEPSAWEFLFRKSSDFIISWLAFVIPFGFRFGRWLKPTCFMILYTVRSLGICTPSGCFSSNA